MIPIALLVSLLLLAACTVTEANPATALPTPTTMRVVQIQATPVPTLQSGAVNPNDRQMQPVPSAPPQTAVPTDAPAATPVARCEGTTGQPETRHTVQATLAYRDQSVAVTQHVAYVNRTGEALSQIVFDVEPNRLPGAFTINTLTNGDDMPVPAYELAGRRLAVDLAEPLGPECATEFDFDLRLQIPQVGVGEQGYIGYFGFSARQINLANWLPTVAVRNGQDWLVHDSVPIGEQKVAGPADWDVTLTIEDAPAELQVVGAGVTTAPEPGTWHIRHTNARDLAISMSTEFRKATQVADNGTTVELYTFNDADATDFDGATHALDVAARSLAMYDDLFGDYPHERYVIVEGDFPDGMEFSGLVFVSGDWFRSYEGQPTSYLTIITVHETAHQWWYAQVGNDAALAPWLDEALATYSEYIFYEEYYPNLKDWWWRFRVNAWIPEGFDDHTVDSPIYEFSTVREYINAVYLRGVRLLHDLRRDLGTDAFFDWLRRYAEAEGGRIATSDRLWALLTPAQLEATRRTREAYLTSGEAVVAADGTQPADDAG